MRRLLLATLAAALLAACAPLEPMPAEPPSGRIECVTPGAPCPPGPQ